MFAIRPVTLRTKYVFQRVNCCDWYIVVPLRYYSAASERDRGCAPLIQSGHSSALNRTSFVQTRGPKNDFDFPPFHEAIAFTIAGHTWIQVAMNVEAAVSLALPTVGSIETLCYFRCLTNVVRIVSKFRSEFRILIRICLDDDCIRLLLQITFLLYRSHVLLKVNWL